MAQVIINSFTAYSLSEREYLEGCVLNVSQQCLLQTELAQVATQLAELQIDPLNPLSAVQEQAFLRGQQKLLQNLIERSTKAQEELLTQSQ
jgi:hypothetical protein